MASARRWTIGIWPLRTRPQQHAGQNHESQWPNDEDPQPLPGFPDVVQSSHGNGPRRKKGSDKEEQRPTHDSREQEAANLPRHETQQFRPTAPSLEVGISIQRPLVVLPSRGDERSDDGSRRRIPGLGTIGLLALRGLLRVRAAIGSPSPDFRGSLRKGDSPGCAIDIQGDASPRLCTVGHRADAPTPRTLIPIRLIPTHRAGATGIPPHLRATDSGAAHETHARHPLPARVGDRTTCS